MKKTFLILSKFALILFVISCSTQEAVDVKSEIEEANISFMKAINNGDAEALSGIYLPDATVYPPNSDKIYGADNIVPIMAGSSASGVKVKFETVSAMAYGSVAIEEGQYKILAGDMVVDHGKYIVTWKKKGSEWMVSKDIYNTSMPAAPRAAPGDTVLIGVTTARSEKLEKMDEFQKEVFLPAFKEFYPDSYAATRLLKTDKPDGNGNFYYIYISDPFTYKQTHMVWTVLEKKYSEDEIKKIREKYSDIFSDQKAYIAVEQVW